MSDRSHRYDDIIYLPHHVSANHPQMSREQRAAQFSPFAALSGYGEAVGEAARFTERRLELDENMRAELDVRICDAFEQRSRVSIVHFVADRHKEGGSYMTSVGIIVKIDEHEGIVALDDGQRLDVLDIVEISLPEQVAESDNQTNV